MSVKNKKVAKGYRVKVEERTEIQRERGNQHLELLFA